MRELMVSGIRMLSAGKGEVIAAKMLGKIKTFVTMIAIGVLFFYGLHDVVMYIGISLIYVACFFTIISGIEYFWKSRHIILESI
jgi:CDP-diacylglycerol--glycerol-3-phosphate 3-phosphatidyltransferase